MNKTLSVHLYGLVNRKGSFDSRVQALSRPFTEVFRTHFICIHSTNFLLYQSLFYFNNFHFSFLSFKISIVSNQFIGIWILLFFSGTHEAPHWGDVLFICYAKKRISIASKTRKNFSNLKNMDCDKKQVRLHF